MRLLFLIPCFALLAGCATPGATSTGGELPASEATYLSDMMVKIISLGLDKERPVYIAPSAQDTLITKAFQDQIRYAGYSFTSGPGPGIQQVRYQVGAYGQNAVLLRMQIDEEEITATFQRHPSGVLEVKYPFSVRRAAP